MLIIFDSAYLLRVVCCLTVFMNAYQLKDIQQESLFDYNVRTLTPSIFLDAIPILSVLIVHYRSFKSTNDQSTEAKDQTTPLGQEHPDEYYSRTDNSSRNSSSSEEESGPQVNYSF